MVGFLQYRTQRWAMFGGWTCVAARAVGKIIAITLANNIPGHLAEPGKLSETHELTRVKKMVRKLICTQS